MSTIELREGTQSMRSKDPARMEQISNAAGEYFRRNHTAPTVRQLAADVGMSKSAVYNYLVEMNRQGMIAYEDGKIRSAPKMEKARSGYLSAPLVGSIRCGDPEEEQEAVEMYVSLPEAIFGKGPAYLVRASGDSMEDVGIREGDLVLIRRQSECKVGDVVVALDENNENTLKVYGGVNEENHKAILCYANERVYPGRTIEVDRLVVQGVAKHVISSL